MKTRDVINLVVLSIVVLGAIVGLSYKIGFERGKDAATKFNETAGALILKGEMLANASTQVDLARLSIHGDDADIKNAKSILKLSLERYQKERDVTIANDMFKRSFFEVVEKDVSEVLAELSADPSVQNHPRKEAPGR